MKSNTPTDQEQIITSVSLPFDAIYGRLDTLQRYVQFFHPRMHDKNIDGECTSDCGRCTGMRLQHAATSALQELWGLLRNAVGQAEFDEITSTEEVGE